jgi:hypothetical protein
MDSFGLKYNTSAAVKAVPHNLNDSILALTVSSTVKTLHVRQ